MKTSDIGNLLVDLNISIMKKRNRLEMRMKLFPKLYGIDWTRHKNK